MLISRNNFDHDPPWRYAVMECLPFKSQRKGSEGKVIRSWYTLGKYKTMKSALQALEAYKAQVFRYKYPWSEEWNHAERRIEHVYYEPKNKL